MITLSGWTVRAPSAFTRFFFLVLLSGALMILDHRGHQLEQLRRTLTIVTYPLQLAAALPARTAEWFGEFFSGRKGLRAAYDRLQADHLALQAKLQKFEQLEADNRHLRELLGAAPKVSERATVAEILELSPEPFTRRIVLSKGSLAGAHEGQVIIDAYGIMGRITEVSPIQSRAILITDPAHSVPVQVVRNGLRAIVNGTGSQDYVDVPYLTAVADIKEGDLLVSSGMGGTFPAGYPVAQVVRVINNPNESFLKIYARPVARLDHNKEVMLIWPQGAKHAPAREPK